MAEQAVRLRHQAGEAVDVRQDAGEPHDGELREEDPPNPKSRGVTASVVDNGIVNECTQTLTFYIGKPGYRKTVADTVRQCASGLL